MTNFERIATSAPVNATAARVTGGGNSPEELTWEQKRENIVAALLKTEEDRRHALTDEEYDRLGKRIHELQGMLRYINEKIATRRRGTSVNYFVDAARALLTKEMMESIWNEAHRLRDETVGATTPQTVAVGEPQ